MLAGTVLEVCLLLVLLVGVALLTRRRSLPLSVGLVVVGLLLSTVGASPGLGELRGETFEQVVVFLFLPALVFAAALDLDLRAFLQNLRPVLALAILGFVLSAVLVGVSVHLALSVPLVVALLFGALISATDPVAVVAVFRDLGVPRRLLVLVEGESLLNDGVAIVLSSVLLTAALGTSTGPVEGVLQFLLVFLGGALIGVVLGAVAAFALPWLQPLPAVALSLAVAYGGFVLAEEVLGFSGVMATAAAGLVLAGVAPSRGSAPLREAWRSTWETLDYLANGLLFLLIGFALGLTGLLEHVGAILVAAAAVLVARALAVVPVVWLAERFAGVPRVGRRNETVLVWGGLRGGVALALALALPEDLADRDLLVAMTGGVVLVTLLLNATTIGAVVRRLGIDRPSPADRFLAAAAHLAGLQRARQRLEELGLHGDGDVERRITDAERQLGQVELSADEELRVVVGRGLHVERATYQMLSDGGLLPAPVARTLMSEVDQEVDELSMHGEWHRLGSARPAGRRLADLLRRLEERLPSAVGEDAEELAYAEATARRLAAHRTGQALELFDSLPSVRPESVQQARELFERWERRAVERLAALDVDDPVDVERLRARQVALLAEAESVRALHDLTVAGVLPARLASPAD